jgi:hypothetical protein
MKYATLNIPPLPPRLTLQARTSFAAISSSIRGLACPKTATLPTETTYPFEDAQSAAAAAPARRIPGGNSNLTS